MDQFGELPAPTNNASLAHIMKCVFLFMAALYLQVL